jgi:fructokinase
MMRPMAPASQPRDPPGARPPRLGVDLGGTKIEVAALGDDGRVAWRRRTATPRDDYAATVAAIGRLVHEAEAAVGAAPGACRVGVGIPGTISALTGRVKNANSTWLNGRPLREDLDAALDRPVRIANDANCLAVSEAVDGAAAGAAVVFGVILGTGVGGGVALHGRAHVGPNGIAGEWGHVPLPGARDDERPGPRCWCGRHGCLEAWLSGPALAADHARATGARIAPEAIARGADGGHARCAATLDRWLDRLARGLALVIDVLDPDAVVLGGGLSTLPGLCDALPARVAPHVFSDDLRTRIVPARHGAASGVRGAAWLWPPD